MAAPELGRRAKLILEAVVKEYLHGESAVGSRTIAEKHALQLSPATVRGVMADLESMGLLAQRHVSGGRAPTASGLRFFIDAMLKVRALSTAEQDAIRSRLVADRPAEVLRRASSLLSELTQHAGLVLAPDPASQRFRHIEFVPLRGDKLIAVLVTNDGQLENRLLSNAVGIHAEQLDRINAYLNRLLSGMTLDEAREAVLRELGHDKYAMDSAVAAALTLGRQLFVETPTKAPDVVIAGGANLVSNDSDAAQMRELLRTLEDKTTLAGLLDQTRLADRIQVFLGGETAVAALADSSVVAVPYGSGERPLGALAVIGPMRMNYAKVMSVVEFTAEAVSEILSDL